MKELRRPASCLVRLACRWRRDTSAGPGCSLAAASEPPRQRLGVGKPVAPASGNFGGEARTSHVHREPFWSYAVLSDPGRAFAPCPLRRIRVALFLLNQKAPAICHFSRLDHTALALAVYASCRPLERLRKTRFRLAGLPCPGGIAHPQGSYRVFQFRFALCHLSTSSLSAFSWRDNRHDTELVEVA